MDRYAAGMVARGPTLSADRTTWTGSVHIVDLPDVRAPQEFVDLEPYNRAGLYERHSIWGFHDLLGRTMWQTPTSSSDGLLFLVLALVEGGGVGSGVTVPDLSALARRPLVVHGELRALDAAGSSGAVVALRARSRQGVEDLLAHGRVPLSEHTAVQIHDWEFGGRR